MFYIPASNIVVLDLVAAETRYCTVSVSTGPQHIVDFGRTRQHSETLGSRCGDKSRPWTVDALNGQRIVVSLIDFMAINTTNSQLHSGKQYANVYFVLKCLIA